MRAFVAIDLPDTVRDRLESLQDDLRVGRVMDPETLHLTLAFLGDQPVGLLEEVHEALGAIRLPAFDLALQGLGTFGARHPAVLWAGVAPQPALVSLRNEVRRAVRLAGLELPRERFRPHVTLARFGRGMKAEELESLRRFLENFGGFSTTPFAVERFTLFESLRYPDGAVHEVLEEYPLGLDLKP